jgi:cytochrome b subunit of formate dehydrogenase/nitrate/TMAO reductase-like tetraheme cytochrome c subunit
MKRLISTAIILLLLLSWLLYRFNGASGSRAQTQASPAPTAASTNNATVRTNMLPATTTNKPVLNCQECHGPGKTLPYLGGELFHKDAHSAYSDGFHAKAVQTGRRAATCLDCHATGGDMTTMLPKSNPQSTINRANIATTCGKCHSDANVMKGSGISSRPFLSYQESVHAQAVARGNTNAAVCTDCHRSHDILPASDARSPIFKFNVPQTCGQCHADIASEYSQSVHGQAAARGVSQTPVCTDCHGIHDIMSPQIAAASLRTNTCAKCHEGVRLTQEFGVAGERVASYQNSYHGLARRLGSNVAADCASCHGVHNILPSSDPRSMIAPANLTQTCGQCHPGAGENFARGNVHLNAPLSQDAGSTGVRLVRLVYLTLIFLTIGGMVLHNLLIWRKKAAAKLRREQRTIPRLTSNQRAQHWLLLTSFIVLVVTGFALVYPGDWSYYLGLSAETTRRFVHRIAAVVMIIVGIYHLSYLATTKEGRAWVRDMRPRLRDVLDGWQNFLYYAGLRQTRPKIARFGYAEKAEYWAVVWGTFVMGLTGLLIWFKLGAFSFLPRWWVDIAIAIHFYEAVLATLAIIVWHFYHVIFDPDVYPVNFAFYDGRVSAEFYREEHELDYEQLLARKEAETEAPADAPETAGMIAPQQPAEGSGD